MFLHVFFFDRLEIIAFKYIYQATGEGKEINDLMLMIGASLHLNEVVTKEPINNNKKKP